MRRTRQQDELKRQWDGDDEPLGPNYPRWIMYGILAAVAVIAFRAWLISEEERGKRAGDLERAKQELRHRMDAARDKAGQDALDYLNR